MAESILVTGNQGYIGSVLQPILVKRGYPVIGLDVGYYSDCLLEPQEVSTVRQIVRDIRDIEVSDLVGIKHVIHLAALSNDPLGELSPHLTREINYEATLRLASIAKRAGVSRFVFASSQSMYGVADSGALVEEDNSNKNPVTEYAKTKWQAEQDLLNLSDESFAPVFFRPSTVFGASPRLRCDIVFNNFVGCGYTSGRIEIKSDGTPWRPVVHIRDVCKAFIAGIEAPDEIVRGRAFNVGIPDGNFTVREIAEAAQRSLPGCELEFTGEHGGDSRTYRVSFDRILSELRDFYKPSWNLDRGGNELVEFFERTNFNEGDFSGERCVRLKKLQELLRMGIIDDRLKYT